MKITNNFKIPQFKTSFKSSNEKQNNKENSSNIIEFSKNSSNAIKNNALSLINFKGGEELKISDIVEKLKKEYKIDANFETLDTASLTLEAIEDFVKLNNKDMFEGLKIIPSERNCWTWDTGANTGKKEFVLRLDNKTKEEFKEYTKLNYDACYFGSNNPKYELYRHLGEFLNFNYNPYAYTSFSKNVKFSQILDDIAGKIGLCASENLAAFNSNYIASRMCGVDVPTAAKKCYKDLMGADLNFPPAKLTRNSFKNIHNFNSVDEASEYLKQYGVTAEFHNLKCANLTIEAIEDFIEINDNPKMFDGLIIKSNIDPNPNVSACVASCFDFQRNEITSSVFYFNKSYDWDRHKLKMVKNYSAGHNPSIEEKTTIYHELAHWLDFQSRPENYTTCFHEYGDRFKMNDYGKRITGKVSAYAKTNPIEFIAEYVAGRMNGYDYPTEVKECIQKLTPLDLKFPSESQQ